MTQYVLDARGLLCPMPVIKVQNKAKHLNPDDTIEILCTDPGTKQDIPTWCRIYGHQVIDIIDREEDIAIYVKILKEADEGNG